MCVFMSKPLIDRDFTCHKYVQNNWKKQLTSPCCFEILLTHTVTTEQKQKHMRTKTLLIAAAALAVSAGISMAQTYSQNVVGYANVVIHGNGQYTLLANPFDDGNGNYATNLLNSALPKQSQFITWDPVLTYTTVQKAGTPANWPAGTITQLPPGMGFFVRNGSVGGGAPDLTNTFVGTVVVQVGASVTNSVVVGYTLQGSPIPYSGNLALIGQNGGDTNMNFGGPLTKGSQLITWDPVLTFTTVQKSGTPATWQNTVNVGVGQGFFVFNKNGPATNVVETLNP
jgi:hypothetical protein